MNNQERLPVDLRQKAYAFSLFIYETFEALPERGILVQDIESGVNRLLAKIASYAASDLRDRLIKDIISEIRAIKALLGIVRDISLVERHPASELFIKITELESIFSDLLPVVSKIEPLVGPDPTMKAFSDLLPLDVSDELAAGDPGQDDMVPDDTKHVLAKEAERPIEEGQPDKSIESQSEKSGEAPASIRSPHFRESEAGHLGEARESVKPGQFGFVNQPRETSAPVNFVVSARQEAIVEVLKRREKVSVGELAKLFSGRVSAKTLQRDLQELIERRMVTRQGERRWAMYLLAG